MKNWNYPFNFGSQACNFFFLFPERHDFIAFDNTERGTFYLIIGTKDWSQNPKHNLNFDIDFPSGLGGKKNQLFP